MATLNDILKVIDEAPVKFNAQIPDMEKSMFRDISVLLKDLKLTANGKIEPSIENLKLINSIKVRLDKILVSKQYSNLVKEFVGNFPAITNFQTGNYDVPNETKKLISETTRMNIDNTLESLIGSGYKQEVVSKLYKTMLTNVTSGASYADMVENLRNQLTTTEQSPGMLSKYTRTYVTDALGQLAGQGNKMISDTLDSEWFQYVGSNLVTTREFCKHLTKKRYVHKSEITELLKGEIDGHKCKIYEATGLPFGMIEGTNEDNFVVNRGGHNCGHELIPVNKMSIPKSIRDKFETIATEGVDTHTGDYFSRNVLNIEKKINIKIGNPMTFDEANELKGNVNYNKGGGYRINCQSCVVANEMRRRGFDVTAMPNTQKSDNVPYKLSKRTEMAWIDPETGKYPIKNIAGLGAKSIGLLSKEMAGFMTETGRYNIDFVWKGVRSGHIISVEKLENGKFRFYDPQNGKIIMWADLSKRISLKYGVKVLRIDDKLINEDIVDNVVSSL